jgi:hypothetical protein
MTSSPYARLSPASLDDDDRTVIYEPLLVQDGEETVFKRGASRHPSPSPLSLHAIFTTPRLALLASLLISFVLSAVNLTFLSTRSALRAYTSVTHGRTKTPSVYVGLEGLQWEQPRCRSRRTYPVQYAQVENGESISPKRIHGPEDEVMFSFGQKVGPHHSAQYPTLQ